MLSKIILPGDKFELEMLNFEKKSKKSTYSSKIYDIIEEDKIKAAMPMEKSTVIPLAVNTKYELFIYSKSGVYRCKATLIERYKEDNLYIMVLEVFTGLQKYQRRDHYRLSCNIDLKYRILSDEEAEDFCKTKASIAEIRESIQHNTEYIKGITLDISGGGMRFVSGQPVSAGSYIMAEFEVPVAGKSTEYSLFAQIVTTREVPNKKHTYEHRIKFENILSQDRERLIKFIFEEERRYRKNEKS